MPLFAKVTAFHQLLLLALALPSSPVAAQIQFYPLPILSATQAIAAITYDDFDPLHSGKELGILMADGSITELTLGVSGWVSNIIFQSKGGGLPWNSPAQRVSLRVGDVLSENAGREIVLSYNNQVVAVYRSSDGWTNRIIADFSDYIGTLWGAEVGDCDPVHPGDEVFSIFEGVLDFSSGTLYGQTNNIGWTRNEIYYGEVGMDAAIGDSNPDLPGNELIVVTEMGPAYELTPPSLSGLWPRRTIWDDFDNAGWVVRIGEVDPQLPGNEVVYGTRYSDRIMMSHQTNGTNMHKVDILLTGINTNMLNSMFDVAIGQVLSASPAAQILGVDGSGSLYLVQQITNHWQGSIVWQDTNALYAVVAADLIPSLPGDEIVVAGASGTVTLLCNPAPVLNLALTPQQQAVLSWTALNGLSYHVETSTNLASTSSWKEVTNVVHHGAFIETLTYTNNEAALAQAAFFRIRTKL